MVYHGRLGFGISIFCAVAIIPVVLLSLIGGGLFLKDKFKYQTFSFEKLSIKIF